MFRLLNNLTRLNIRVTLMMTLLIAALTWGPVKMSYADDPLGPYADICQMM